MKRWPALPLILGLFFSSGVAVAADLPRGVKSGIMVERFSMHSQQGVSWAAEGIRDAKKDVLVESFGVSNRKVVSAMSDRLRRNVPVRANADPENLKGDASSRLNKAGADFRPWGGNAIRKGEYRIKLNPRKVHAKAVHFDNKSWLSTASLMWEAVSIDATAVTSGKTSKAARAITDRAFHNDPEGMRAAADKGRRHGILLNDASAKIAHLTDGMNDLIGSAKNELVVGMKAVESVDFAKTLSNAASRGVKVTLVTRPSKMSAEARAALSPAVRLVKDPYDVLHGNMIIADRKVAIFGSAHATDRALGKGSRRQSREMGYVVNNSEAIEKMRDALLAFTSLNEQ